MQKITTFLTFESRGKEAVEFYVSIFKNSKVNGMMVMPSGGQLLHASFTLDGADYMAMDGGPHFKFDQGFSLFVMCKDQVEIDYYWEKLTADGGKPGQCGWLQDKFNVSWQIIPTRLGELMQDIRPEIANKTRQAMLKMGKIDIAVLETSANS